jgi:hypothetical protein
MSLLPSDPGSCITSGVPSTPPPPTTTTLETQRHGHPTKKRLKGTVAREFFTTVYLLTIQLFLFKMDKSKYFCKFEEYSQHSQSSFSR